MRGTICNALPWLALILALLGMRDWDPAIPGSLSILILLVWVINWLVHHISLPWSRYLRILSWVFVGAIIVIPELRAAFEEAVISLLSLQSSTLIVLALVTLIIWGVMCLARPAAQSHSQ